MANALADANLKIASAHAHVLGADKAKRRKQTDKRNIIIIYVYVPYTYIGRYLYYLREYT